MNTYVDEIKNKYIHFIYNDEQIFIYVEGIMNK